MGFLQKKIALLAKLKLACALAAGAAAGAQTADQAWLNYDLAGRAHSGVPIAVKALGGSVIEQSAVIELKRNLGRLAEQNASGPGFTARSQFALGGQTVVGTVEEMRRAFPNLPIPTDLEPEGYWIFATNAQGAKSLLLIGGADLPGV